LFPFAFQFASLLFCLSFILYFLSAFCIPLMHLPQISCSDPCPNVHHYAESISAPAVSELCSVVLQCFTLPTEEPRPKLYLIPTYARVISIKEGNYACDLELSQE
jgi:hypothetical protein